MGKSGRGQRTGLLVLVVCLLLAGCAGLGYRPPPGDQSGPVHGDPGGGGGGGSGGM